MSAANPITCPSCGGAKMEEETSRRCPACEDDYTGMLAAKVIDAHTAAIRKHMNEALDRAAASEAEATALRERIAAIAEKWERDSGGLLCLSGVESDRLFMCALTLRAALRAALRASPTSEPGSDGGEG
jgi:hypothetical protein